MKFFHTPDVVTCSLLWKEWSTSFPNDPLVLMAKESMSKYSRQDWLDMVEEAYSLNKYLSTLIEENIPIEVQMLLEEKVKNKELFNNWRNSYSNDISHILY